ncbi:glycosyl transferase [Chryseobacterium sp. StRB126]|nr:glycosyl transferase [Chryseobacterium sp. StRB126]
MKNNCYVITNQRIVIVEKFNGKILKYKKLNEIEQVNAEMNANYFGNIIFGKPESLSGENNDNFYFFRKRGINFTEDKYAFLSVENINEIIPVFNELGLKVNKTFY